MPHCTYTEVINFEAISQCTELTDAIVTRATRSCVIAADGLILLLTLVKTLGHQREASRLRMKVPLTSLLIRDGRSHCHQRVYSISNQYLF